MHSDHKKSRGDLRESGSGIGGLARASGANVEG